MTRSQIRRGFRSAARGFLGGLLLAGSAPLAAQSAGAAARGEVFAGSEVERYLRSLQVAGEAALYPWSLRGFSPAELDRIAPADSAHPWAARFAPVPDSAGGVRVAPVRPRVQILYNSAFPYGVNDGPVWAGRGVTTVLEAGFAARYGPLSLTVAPQLFRAENEGFELAPNGHDGRLAYASPAWSHALDAPQRFGDEPYVRLDPGQSTLRLDAGGVALGASTANQVWGPAGELPLLLGSNAPGIPHLFLGTAAPVNVGIGRVHGRIVWGRLDESAYSAAAPDSARRFMSGVVGVFSPRGVEGLEIGGARFFHSAWPEGGPTLWKFREPLQGLLKSDVSRGGSEGYSEISNQLVSVFARWVFPRSGVEAYGEYGREDHAWDVRDLLMEPDHTSGYLLGLRKVWRPRAERMVAVRGEVLSTRLSHITEGRPTQPFYVHGYLKQGHTHRGELLGSPGGYGGSGAHLALDHYHPGGRWSLEWRRILRQTREVVPETGEVDLRGEDVLHALGAEALLFRGRFEVTAGLTGVYNLNRDFGADVFNLNAALGVRAGL